GAEATASSLFAMVVPPSADLEAPRLGADVGEPLPLGCNATGGVAPYALTISFGDGGASVGPAATHAYAGVGIYAPSCTVQDSAGGTASVSAAVTVSPPLSVIVGASAPVAAPGTTVYFSAVAENGSGNYTGYAWTFDGAPPVTISSAVALHAFTALGEAATTVTVTDSNEATASASVTIGIVAIAVAFGPIPGSVVSGGTVNLSASASGGAGAPYEYTWHFGDGFDGEGSAVTHAYRAPGTYRPSVLVYDRLGGFVTVNGSAIIVRSPAPAAPILTAPDLLGLSIAIGAGGAFVVELLRASQAPGGGRPRRLPPTPSPRGSSSRARAPPHPPPADGRSNRRPK
ncbi:MAG TPA: PKD domain-containing protein, partial [Thermoplasmata archaeon]|nr:PKD domain-containing protein [Thermoplasmata archaeon]